MWPATHGCPTQPTEHTLPLPFALAFIQAIATPATTIIAAAATYRTPAVSNRWTREASPQPPFSRSGSAFYDVIDI